MSKAPEKDARAVELGTWLREYRTRLGLKRPDVISEIYKLDPRATITPDYLSKIEYGVRSLAKVSPDTREALRQALHIPIDVWTRETGLATPWQESQISRALSNGAQLRQHQGDEVHGGLSFVRMPVRAIAQAGLPFQPNEVSSLGTELVPLDQHRDGMVVLEVDGHSMDGGDVNDLKPGDRIYVDVHDKDLRDGKVFVVYVHGNGMVVKRVRFLFGQPILTSDNPDFAPIKPDEADVVGRVYFIQPRGRTI